MPKDLNVILSLFIFSLPLIYQCNKLLNIRDGKVAYKYGYVFSRVVILYILMTVVIELTMIFFNPPPDDCVDCALALYVMPPVIIGLGLFFALLVNFMFFGLKIR